MKQYNNLIRRNDLLVNKYTIKGKSTIVDTNIGRFVLKGYNKSDIYRYLASRNFEYFPKIIDIDDNSIMYEYIDNIEYDNAQKAFDLIHLIALLHSRI